MKNIIIAVIVAIAVVLGGISLFQDTRENNFATGLSEYGRMDVDLKEKIDLTFDHSRIKVVGWEKNYASVRINPWFAKTGNLPGIACSENKMTLEGNTGNQSKSIFVQVFWPWFPLAQFETYHDDFFNNMMDNHEFVIHVPQSAKLEVKSDILDAENSILVYVKGNIITLDKCILPKDFKGDAYCIEVRDSIISNKAVFNKKTGTMRDNKYID